MSEREHQQVGSKNKLFVGLVVVGAVALMGGYFLSRPHVTTAPIATKQTIPVDQPERWKGHSETQEALAGLAREATKLRNTAHADLAAAQVRINELSNVIGTTLVAECVQQSKRLTMEAISALVSAASAAQAADGINDPRIAPILLEAARRMDSASDAVRGANC